MNDILSRKTKFLTIETQFWILIRKMKTFDTSIITIAKIVEKIELNATFNTILSKATIIFFQTNQKFLKTNTFCKIIIAIFYAIEKNNFDIVQ